MYRIKAELKKEQKTSGVEGDTKLSSNSALICSYDLFFEKLWELSKFGNIGSIILKSYPSSLVFFEEKVKEKILPLDSNANLLLDEKNFLFLH